jgi:hypothetical protein
MNINRSQMYLILRSRACTHDKQGHLTRLILERKRLLAQLNLPIFFEPVVDLPRPCSKRKILYFTHCILCVYERKRWNKDSIKIGWHESTYAYPPGRRLAFSESESDVAEVDGLFDEFAVKKQQERIAKTSV